MKIPAKLLVMPILIFLLAQKSNAADPYFEAYRSISKDDGPTGVFSTGNYVYVSGITNSNGIVYGIGGYDLLGRNDQIIPVNIRQNSGQVADLIMYRPGSGVVFIQKFDGKDNWINVSASSNGINGMDLKWATDRILPIKYNEDDLTDLIVYRPGTGCVNVMKGTGNGGFETTAGGNCTGLNGYDLRDARDRFVVGDFNHDRREDLIAYRPGGRAHAVLLSNGDGTFTNVSKSSDLDYYDFAGPTDQIATLDYDVDGTTDILVSRPGQGIAWLLHSEGNGTMNNPEASFGVSNNKHQAADLFLEAIEK